MKFIFKIFILIFLLCCTNDRKTNVDFNQPPPASKIPLDSFSVDKPPAKTAIDFLKWYRDNISKQEKINLVNNNDPKSYDSTRFYSINTEAVESLLVKLKASGFVTDNYIKELSATFENWDSKFKARPQNEFPLKGAGLDAVLDEEEFDDALRNLDNIQIVDADDTKNGDTYVCLKITSHAPNRYILKKTQDKWYVDKIEVCD